MKAPLWTEERTAIALKAWQGGLPAAQIGRMVGLSGNAVIGKMDRLRKSGVIVRGGTPQQSFGVKAMTLNDKRTQDRVSEHTVQGNRTVAAFDAAMPNTGIPLLELRGYQCRFPTSASWPWLACGKPTDKSSYCQKCSERVYGRAA